MSHTSATDAPSSRPNIVVVMSDQHRASLLGSAGNDRAVTPHLDQLAASGVRFANACCNNPMCVPSRLSFLTGKTTNQIEVWSLSDTIRSDELTWPALLGAAGYDTAISGRMHHWWPDKHHGFHRRLCGERQTRVATSTYELYEPGPRRDQAVASFSKVFRGELDPGRTGVGDNHGLDDDTNATAHAVRFIEQRAAGGDTPFALCVGYICPHSPFRCPAEWFDRFRDMPVTMHPLDPTLPPILKTFARQTRFAEGYDERTFADAVRAYYAMVTFIDHQVGQLIDALKRTGLHDNTVVLYTSDHGEMLGERGLFFKNQLLEQSIRVPLIISGPAPLRRGAVVEDLVSLVDVFPTLGDLAGQPAPAWHEAAGSSLMPLLKSGDEAGAARFADRAVFTEYADFGIGEPAACVRWRNFKLLAARNHQPVLYDLHRDPGETVDLYRDPRHADVVRRLEAELARFWNPDDTYRRVVRNQNRVDLVRQSRMMARQRGYTLDPGVTTS